jgi:hypothetical protein
VCARLEVVESCRPGTWEKVGYSGSTVQPYPHLAIDCDEELMPESRVLAGIDGPGPGVENANQMSRQCRSP